MPPQLARTRASVERSLDRNPGGRADTDLDGVHFAASFAATELVDHCDEPLIDLDPGRLVDRGRDRVHEPACGHRVDDVEDRVGLRRNSMAGPPGDDPRSPCR